MPKAVFAAAIAVALVIPPMPQLISSAAAQQKTPASDKNAKTKKEPSDGQLAARERQKKCAAEWKEAKAANKVEKERPGQNSGATATSASSPLPNSGCKY